MGQKPCTCLVKLLRQLGLSLEEIRQAQRGDRPLSDLLREREAALEQQQEELEDMKARLAAERVEEQQKLAEEQQAMKEKFDAEQKEAYEKMQEQIAAARIEIRREMQAQMDEKTAQQKRELTMISEELERLNERFLLLKTRIVELAEQE